MQDTPEWKRRLKEGEEIASDAFDLFSPSKLEGVFKQSSCPAEPAEVDDESIIVAEKRPWNTLSDSAFPPPSDFTTYRTSRSRPSGMDTVREEEYEDKSFDLSAISSDIVENGDIQGIVRRRVSSLESAQIRNSWRNSKDPRMRTISGRKEISDEVLSPLEDSERSSIRKQALQQTLDSNVSDLRSRLRGSNRTSQQRSSSRSNDHEISYDAQGLNNDDQSCLREEPNPELTSQSLPEDLSMGTQMHQPNSILEVVTSRQRPSHVRKSSVPRASTRSDEFKTFRSSPPPYQIDNSKMSRFTASEPTSPVDTSVVHHVPASTQQSTAGSPLKLFGNRDTYTNNKLMRVLSQFEETESDLQGPAAQPEVADFRMSTFGRGELDGFGFHQEIQRPVVPTYGPENPVEKLFNDAHVLQDAHKTEDTRISSPVRERSPKRRRTLLKDEIFVDGTEVEIKLTTLADNTLAGKKRRDARPGDDPADASPNTLATRSIRRPSGSRKSSGHSRAASAAEALQNITNSAPKFAEELANELQSFVENAAEIKHDSRKASLATKDYMEEANKVMEFIRARGKPKPPMPEIREPEEASEPNPDAILDLDLDESTKDDFSRPPSREGRVLPRQDRRYAQHDIHTANHLSKFRDADDLELLASTSVLGTLHLADNRAVEEAALVPVPEDEEDEGAESFESDPPGMRILVDNDKKRKHSAADIDSYGSQSSQQLHSGDSKRTVNTTSSSGSGIRGVISQGTVSIPDTIGPMIFDKDKQIWVKQNGKASSIPAPIASPESKSARHEVSEADPFDGIPDLSFDERKEATWKKSPKYDSKTSEIGAGTADIVLEQDQASRVAKTTSTPYKSSLKSPRRRRNSLADVTHSQHTPAAARREALLYDGLAATDVDPSGKQQARVVTIAFSSPIASEIPYIRPVSMSDADFDEDDPSLLPLDDEGSVLVSSPAGPNDGDAFSKHDPNMIRPIMCSIERHEQYRAMTLNRRPVSRIEEYDEEVDDIQEMSLIHIKHTDLTPMPERHVSIRKTSSREKSSILCLTPLSEFTLHQADKVNHPEESFVADRANPKALRQANGSHALVEDALVKAITDAEQSELFWDQICQLSLVDSGLEALHGLKRYCSSLESLNVCGNKISQLSDVPSSIRSLQISANLINDLTSWAHLHNLQTIDVSGNQLEGLESFSKLIHLRHLDASNNRIRNIDGVLQSDVLVSLNLAGNDIPEVDFEGSNLVTLNELNLSKNNLMHAKNLHFLPRLEYLDLTENLLEDLDIPESEAIKELKTFCLAQNELVGFRLAAFPALERLNLDNNNISQIEGLSKAQHLQLLSLRAQRVTSNLINDILCTPHDCTELYLSENILPESGLNLPDQPNFTLRCLELASCGLESLPSNLGNHFPNLRVLNLNFNGISDLAPLQGAIKLKSLYIGKNRIRKMRRTCLTLSRLPSLKKVDLRDNPVSIGFYRSQGEEGEVRPHLLAQRDTKQDRKWLGLMDETTWLRRRTMELLLVDCCRSLEEMDGMLLDRSALKKEKVTWERLMRKGVLKQKEETMVSVNEVNEHKRDVDMR